MPLGVLSAPLAGVLLVPLVPDDGVFVRELPDDGVDVVPPDGVVVRDPSPGDVDVPPPDGVITGVSITVVVGAGVVVGVVVVVGVGCWIIVGAGRCRFRVGAHTAK